MERKTTKNAIPAKKRDIINRELVSLHDKHGYITADMVVAEASSDRHPLHRYFQWNDVKAAHEHRLATAREMIRASDLVDLLREARGQPVAPAASVNLRAFLPMLTSGPRCGGDRKFKMRNEALSDVDNRELLIHRHLTTLRSWCNETADIAELQEIRSVVLRALAKYDTKVA